MTADPRICRTPLAEFDHLTLREIAEFSRLWRKLVSDGGLTLAEQVRLAYISARRVRPQYETARKGAA